MSIAQKRGQLQKLLGELEAGQREMEGGPISQTRGDELEAKAMEAEAIQSELDHYERISNLTAKGREVAEVHIPRTADQSKDDGDTVVGYKSFGQLYSESEALRSYIASGAPKVQVAALLEGKGSLSDGLVPVTRSMLERKAVTATGLIAPDRTNRVFDTAPPQRLFLRDVVEVLRTDSNVVQYSTFTYTEAAAIVAAGGLKPEAALTSALATTTVRDIAVTAPVSEQTLADAAQIQGILDGRMRRDIQKKEEREMLWGDGTGLLGIMQTPGVGEMVRTRTGATLLDKVRMAITDIRLAEVEPNAVALHPIDWEDVQLLKGTDNSYVWTVVTDAVTGQSRIWGLSVVETVAVVKPGLTERRALVGAFAECATLWDRNQITAAIGYVNDQFQRNERTIRLEERVAFATHTPFGFRYIITANAGL